MHKRPAEWVRQQARRRERRVWTLIAVGLTMMVVSLWLSLGLRESGVALAFLVAMLVIYRVADHEGAAAVSWIRGARSEQAVGEELNRLRGNGYTVMHDIEQIGEGNIDHLVSGPTGVYLVETKHRRYEAEHLRKARRQAAKLHDKLGVWVTPVVCLAERKGRAPYRHDGVWIVGRDRLTEWLSVQRNPGLAFDQLAIFADEL
jgi:hypothetical protein